MFSKWKKGVSVLLTVSTIAASTAMPMGSADNTVEETRNIALKRAVYHSSAANYEDTGHLITDGIINDLPYWDPDVVAQYNDSPSNEGPTCAFDGNQNTKWLTFHNAAWLQVGFPEYSIPTVTSYSITSANDAPLRDPKGWTLQGSNDGVAFTDIDARSGETFGSRFQKKTYTLSKPAAYRYFRLNITENNGDIGTDGNTPPRIQLADFDLFEASGESVVLHKDTTFNSIWRSKTAENEWVYVDFGADSTFDKVNLFWNSSAYATKYDIQISDDAEEWNTIYSNNDAKGGEETITFSAAKARYLRLFCRESNSDCFALSELEVYGSNDLTYSVGEMPAPEADGTQKLSGGNWKVERAEQVTATGEQLASAYDDTAWLPATVPGTVLTSYLNAGAVPDPNIADQQLLISDSYFTTNWWY